MNSSKSRVTTLIGGVLMMGALLIGANAVFSAVGTTTQPPVNDLLEQATDLTFVELTATDRVDASLATAGAAEPNHIGAPQATVWWRWTARVNAAMVVSTKQSAVTTSLAVYEHSGANPPALVQIGSAPGLPTIGASVSFSAVAGQTYAFVIDQPSGKGEVELTLRYATAALSNDDFANATPVGLFPFTDSTNNGLGSAETNEVDHAGEPPAHSAWWSWTAPGAGPVTIDTCGSIFDTTLAVHTGTAVDTLIEVASNDDATLSCDSKEFGLSEVQFTAVGGQQYWIAVDGFVGASGPLVLNIDGTLSASRLNLLASPCVVFSSVGAGSGAIVPGTPETVQVSGALTGQGGAGNCSVPTDATSAVVSLASFDATGTGNLRISAAGVAPAGGVVNYTTNGLQNSNTVTVQLSNGGAVDVATNGTSAQVHMSVVGYYSPAGTLLYTPLTPCAAADSRSDQGSTGTFVGPFAAGAAYPDIDLVGTFNGNALENQGGLNTDCGVPVGADAVMVNVVSVGGSGGAGGLAVGTGGTNPTEPTTNFANIGLNNSASMIVPLAGQTIATNIIPRSGTPSTQIRVVVLGYFGTTGDEYSPVTPCAVFDSRPPQEATGGFLGQRVSGAATTYQISGTSTTGQGGIVGGCGVANGASAVLINLVALDPQGAGNLRAYATGTSPTGGVVNFSVLSPPANNSNAVVVPLSALGQLDLFVNTPSNNGSPTLEVRGVVLGYYS